MQFDIEYLIAAAKKAGLAIMEIYETTDSIEIQSKTDNSPLTNADIAAHETIISELTNKYPHIPIVSEEGRIGNPLDSEFSWLVDPLDGTSNFLRGIPISCVSIALMNELEPILGVIYDFNHKELYFGHKESKAFVNNHEIRVSSLSLKNESTLVTGIPAKTNYSDNELFVKTKK